MTRIRIKNTGIEFGITGVGTERSRLTYGADSDCYVPVYYIKNKPDPKGYCYRGNDYISKDELDYWLSKGDAEIVEDEDQSKIKLD